MKILGHGGHAKVVESIILRSGHKFEGALGKEECPREAEGVWLPEQVDTTLFLAVGDNHRRRLMARNLPDAEFATLIDPSAVVAPTAKISPGTVVMQQATIQADARIGRHCIINTGAIIDHECEIGDFVHISPGAVLCGNVKVGEGAWICAGAIVIPGVKIGEGAIVGAGVTVRHDVAAATTFFG